MSEYDEVQMEYILDLYRNPKNFGTIDGADFSHQEGNPSCGDEIRIDVKIDKNRIADIKFSGKGCAISQAAASILTEKVKGKLIEDVKNFSKEDMLKAIGVQLSPIRLKCGLLALKVLKAGLYGIKGWPGEEEG